MANYRIWKPETHANEFQTHAASVWTDLAMNPGTTLGNIATRLALGTDVVKRVLNAIDNQGGLWRGHDSKGNEFLWRIGDFSDIMVNNFQAARDWLNQHDGALATQMAYDLGLHEAAAIRLALLLEREGSAKITAQ